MVMILLNSEGYPSLNSQNRDDTKHLKDSTTLWKSSSFDNMFYNVWKLTSPLPNIFRYLWFIILIIPWLITRGIFSTFTLGKISLQMEKWWPHSTGLTRKWQPWTFDVCPSWHTLQGYHT